jgi:hypothetical protein
LAKPNTCLALEILTLLLSIFQLLQALSNLELLVLILLLHLSLLFLLFLFNFFLDFLMRPFLGFLPMFVTLLSVHLHLFYELLALLRVLLVL